MAKKPLTREEVTELFSELDASGVLDPAYGRSHESARQRPDGAGRPTAGAGPIGRLLGQGDRPRRRRTIDPLSADDPSGSKVGHTISRAAIGFVVATFALIVGIQIIYGVIRRLNTANLSESVTIDTVKTALKGGVEWGSGFTQFPQEFTVDQADERSGDVEVSVTDTRSHNELEVFSNAQIQGSAFATNALLNNKISRVVYNVWARVDGDGNISHSSLFGLLPAQGTKRQILTFIWTKQRSAATSNIDLELRIVGMDEQIADRIQKQVNSVSSLIVKPGISQGDLEAERDDRNLQDALKGAETLTGGAPEKDPAGVVRKFKQSMQ
ncbi:hypothetical protein Corgl_1772 [Coriobacterium glomerans PW2]|uniref:Uncharacterized protein n=2 Tax=Coriobacterium TaxID=33870 RepID=F2N9B9_CORGP|nr:hypothetical protein Corgl_1772 [Coriobacterium glomerans PW2]